MEKAISFLRKAIDFLTVIKVIIQILEYALDAFEKFVKPKKTYQSNEDHRKVDNAQPVGTDSPTTFYTNPPID